MEMTKEKLFTILLGVLLLVTVVQTIFLLNVSNTINSQQQQISQLSTAAKTLSEMDVSKIAAKAGSGTALPSSITELPGMVGGC